MSVITIIDGLRLARCHAPFGITRHRTRACLGRNDSSETVKDRRGDLAQYATYPFFVVQPPSLSNIILYRYRPPCTRIIHRFFDVTRGVRTNAMARYAWVPAQTRFFLSFRCVSFICSDSYCTKPDPSFSLVNSPRNAKIKLTRAISRLVKRYQLKWLGILFGVLR